MVSLHESFCLLLFFCHSLGIQLLGQRPNGLWNTRLALEYKETFQEDPPANLLPMVESWTRYSKSTRVWCKAWSFELHTGWEWWFFPIILMPAQTVISVISVCLTQMLLAFCSVEGTDKKILYLVGDVRLFWWEKVFYKFSIFCCMYAPCGKTVWLLALGRLVGWRHQLEKCGLKGDIAVPTAKL